MADFSKESGQLIPGNISLPQKEHVIKEIPELIENIAGCGRKAFEVDGKDCSGDMENMRLRPLFIHLRENGYIENARDCALAIADLFRAMMYLSPTIQLPQFWGLDDWDFEFSTFTKEDCMRGVTPFEGEVWKNMEKTLRNPESASIFDIVCTCSLLGDKEEYLYKVAYKDSNFNTEKGRKNLFCAAAYQRAIGYISDTQGSKKLGGRGIGELNANIHEVKLKARTP